MSFLFKEIRRFFPYAFFLLLIGGVSISGYPEYRVIGLFLIAVCLAVIIFLKPITVKPVSQQHENFSYRPLLIAVLFGLWASIISAGLDIQADAFREKLSLGLWFGSIIILALAYINIDAESILRNAEKHKKEIFFVFALTLFTALLRFTYLGKIPRLINGDEGWTGMAALKQFPAAGTIYNNPFSAFEGFGRLHLNIISIFITVFGRNPFALRLFPAIGGTLAIPATYLFARYLLGKRTALVAAFLLAVSHAHIHFSRTAAVAYIHSTWLIPLELYFLITGLIKNQRQRFIIAGILLGFHFHFYFTAQIVLAFLAGFFLVGYFLYRQRIRKNFANLIIFLLTTFITAMPLLFWILNNPDEAGARFAKEGTLQSGWLVGQIALGKPFISIIGGRFVHAFLAIFALPFQEFYWVPKPLLLPITASLFLIGLIFSLKNIKNINFLLINFWFWSGVAAISFFAIPASADSYRLLMVLSVLVIFAALGWERLILLIEGRNNLNRRPSVTVVSLLIFFLAAVFNLKTYFLDFASGCFYMDGDLNGRGSAQIGEFLKSQYPFTQAYLLGEEHYQQGIHPSLDFLSGPVPIINMLESFHPVDESGSLIFIFTPDRQAELPLVKSFYPQGQVFRQNDCDRLSFIAYRVET